EELSAALRFQHDPNYDGANHAYPNLVTLAVGLLRQRGERISEPALAQQTAQQAEGIHASSAQAVESFML
ncbi:histidine kinase, partial [Pseudomonas otitidis]|nr:histidine kinase [Pseudomonas otitidis]